GVDIVNAPIIKGSVVDIDVTGSSPGLDVGTIMTGTQGDRPVKVIVAETYDGTGSLRFVVEKPGTYYSLDAEMNVDPGHHEDSLAFFADIDLDAATYGTPKLPTANIDTIICEAIYNEAAGDLIYPDDVIITGAGAEIKILSLKDTFLYQWNSDKVIDYINVPLDGDFPFPVNPTSNLTTIIADSLSFDTITVGSIDQILVINPGVNYSANVLIHPVDPYTSTNGILDANGVQVGTNGLIVGIPIVGDNIVRSVKVHSSGYNNIDISPMIFTADANNDLS